MHIHGKQPKHVQPPQQNTLCLLHYKTDPSRRRKPEGGDDGQQGADGKRNRHQEEEGHLQKEVCGIAITLAGSEC